MRIMLRYSIIDVTVFCVIFCFPRISILTDGKQDGVRNPLSPIKNTISMSVPGASVLTNASSRFDSKVDSGQATSQEVNTGGQNQSLDIAGMTVGNTTESNLAKYLVRANQLNPQKGVRIPSGNNDQRSVSALPYSNTQSENKEHVPDDKISRNKERTGGFVKSDYETQNNVKHKHNATDVLRKIQEKSKSVIQRLCGFSAHTPKHLCYQHGSSRCYCRGGLADCSGKVHAPNIAYAPRLPSNIMCLSLAFNNIRYLDNSFFANVSQFVVIDFSSNKLQTVSKETFGRFTNLKYLILNDNVLNYLDLHAVFDHPPSLRLDIVGLDLGQVPINYFQNYSTIPTSQIYMDLNYMPTLDLRELAKFDKLEYLSVTFSSVQNVVSAPLCNLKGFYLDNNTISAFPVTCSNAGSIKDFGHDAKYACAHSEKMWHLNEAPTLPGKTVGEEYTSLFPRLTELTLGHNYILSLPPRDQLCLPKTVTFNLQSNNITEIPEGTFTSMRYLKALHLDRMNTGITKIGPSAFNVSAMTSLYLSRNKIKFASKDVSTKLLQGCVHLRVLSIDHNNLDGMTEDMFEELLNNTPALKFIYLSSTEMQFIPVTAFSRLQKLEKLFIYVNAIKEIPPGAFDDMLSLRNLYMDENQITNVKQNAFSPATRLRLEEINLSKNPYSCDCDLLWFQSWLREAGRKQFFDFNFYQCSNFLNTSVQNYVLSKQACLLSRQSYILFTVCLSILLLVFLVFAVLYRYRWNIRLLMYERRASRRNPPELQGGFLYDLFVVYCIDDWDWVGGMLLPVLEAKWGLKACIHQRDFLAGGLIIDNIVESMNGSRRILVVVSSKFADSRWCNFELQICQSHVITHDLPSLVVIVLDDIEARDMRAPMLALYNTTCCLEWPADSQEVGKFYERLKKSLACLLVKESHDTSVMVVE